MALSAFTPLHGQDEACEALPKNSHLTLMMPRVGRHTWVPQRPWIIMAASTSLKTPASNSLTFPAPPSSAGVPMTWMRPAKGSVPRAAAMAAPAPVPAVAMTLWPQACPMFGRASYSAMMAMVGPAAWPSMVARKAVGSPPTPRSTRAPCCSRNAASQPAAFSSWKQSSGVEWIWCEIFSRSSARRSTVSVTLVLAWSSASAVMLVSRLEGMIDRPLQRVRGPSIVGPAAPAQLLDDLAARGHRPVLPELELGATRRDAQGDRGEVVEGALVEGIVDGERSVPSLGLMLGEEALLLSHHHGGILRHPALALEDDCAVIRGGRASVFRVDPVRGNYREDLVHLKGASGPSLQIGNLLVRPHQVELEGGGRVPEVVEADVGRAVLAECHQPAHLLRPDEAVDLLLGNLRVAVVEDHVRLNASLAALTWAGWARRAEVVRAMVLAAA